MVIIKMIPLHEPTFDESDEKLILEALRSSWVSTGGAFVNQFESDFANFIGMKHAISISNGTVGLQIAIESLKRIHDINIPFDIITPSLSFIATPNSIVHAGGTPIFIDTMQGSLQISALLIEQTIQNSYIEKNKKLYNKISGNILLAILPVHVMGWSAPIEEINNLSEKYDLPIIEDAAEALGSYTLDKSHIGKTGIASIFSFNGNKILTTGGGAMLCTNNATFAKRAKHISTTAKTDNLRFIHDEVGYNHRMVNLLAALGCSQLQKLPDYLSRKKNIFELYKEKLAKQNIKLYYQDNCISNNWLVNIIFHDKITREKVFHTLLERNIQARPLWTPCHMQPAYLKYKTNQPETKSFLNTIDIWEKTLSLPTSPNLSNESINIISDIIIKVLR